MSIFVSPEPSKLPPWLVVTENALALRQAGSDVSPSRVGASALSMRRTWRLSTAFRSIDTTIAMIAIATETATTNGFDWTVTWPPPEAGRLDPGGCGRVAGPPGG